GSAPNATLGRDEVRWPAAGFETYAVMNPHDDGLGIDTYIDWLIRAGCPSGRVDDFGEWLQRFDTGLKALPERQRQNSVLQMLTLLRQQGGELRAPEPTQGSYAPADRFRAAVRRAKVGAANDIPRVAPEVILKYV